jgi:hypothetical protein
MVVFCQSAMSGTVAVISELERDFFTMLNSVMQFTFHESQFNITVQRSVSALFKCGTEVATRAIS